MQFAGDSMKPSLLEKLWNASLPSLARAVQAGDFRELTADEARYEAVCLFSVAAGVVSNQPAVESCTRPLGRLPIGLYVNLFDAMSMIGRKKT
jgi:hypothetical protein